MYKEPLAEPIAVVGSGCRFPGGASSPSRLWDLISHPTDISRNVPQNRFNRAAFYHADGEYHGTTNSVKAYWLEQDHRVFDAPFFNITPREAEAIDPQQRLLLEVVYEAMESAGYTLSQVSGNQVAVFSGAMTADYDTLSQRDDLFTSQYYATGNARSIIANRISYFFNFHGPSMTIDTACSASLVALHQAVLSLRSAESRMACVTGVNMMFTPEQFIVESSLHMLSPTGQSRMWDASADGYARGEGVAAIFIKPLSQALADGDTIEALIRETGANSDGRTKGITMPNPLAQAALIRRTYEKSGLDPRNPKDRCQYFEAHGTGTQAGDPKEATAIQNAFFDPDADLADVDDDDLSQTLLVGSIKTVIGHTEGAAGLAGLLKVIQAMKNKTIPPNLHLKNPNPSLASTLKQLHVPQTPTKWPDPQRGHPLRASVNSFGFGGANAHAILESYEEDIDYGLGQSWEPDVIEKGTSSHELPNAVESGAQITLHKLVKDESGFALPFCISAASQKTLPAAVSGWRDYISSHPETSPGNLAWNMFHRRTALLYRVAVSASTRDQVLVALNQLAVKSASGVDLGVRGADNTRKKQKILGVFTGQGAQWIGMSRSLMQTSKIYLEAIQRLDKILQECSDPPEWSLEKQIYAESKSSRVSEAAVSQPLCTALQLGLVALLEAIGIELHTVVGHSSGEIAAAYAAGRLTLRSAILISYYRGKYAHLAGSADGQKGGMLAVGITQDAANAICSEARFQGKICVAANNAPNSVTLSGDIDAIHLVKEEMTSQGIFARQLVVDTAYHSPHMLQPAAEYMYALQACDVKSFHSAKNTAWISSVGGQVGVAPDLIDVEYWRDNMVQSVQFRDAVATALNECHEGFDFAIEIGPHPALKGPFSQTAKAANVTVPYSSLLDRTKDDAIAVSDFLGLMWTRLGPESFDMGAFRGQRLDAYGTKLDTVHLSDLPTYPWDHSQTYFRESRLSRQFHHKTEPPHELLGSRTRDDSEFELRWRNILKVEKIPWLEHHKFQGQALLPASAYCVMAMDATRASLRGMNMTASIINLQDLQILGGIAVDAGSPGAEVLCSLTWHNRGKSRHEHSKSLTATFTLTSCPADGSTVMAKNMTATVFVVLEDPSSDALPPRDPAMAETLPADPEAFYKMMDETGLVYSGPFRTLETIERRYNYSSTTLRSRHPEDSTSLAVSPARLDSCLQSAFLSYSSPGDKSLWTAFLPVSIEHVQFNLETCLAKANEATESEEMTTVDTHMMAVNPASIESKASFTVDIGIFNAKGFAEVQIEGLTVSAVAHTTENADHELYMHTIWDVDPTVEMAQAPVPQSEHDPLLVESCERVASHYLGDDKSLSSFDKWVSETPASLEDFIASSRFRFALRMIQDMGQSLPKLLDACLPLVMQEAHLMQQFHQHVGRLVKQISHKHPSMRVVSVGNGQSGVDECIIEGLGSSFKSFAMVNVLSSTEQTTYLENRLQLSKKSKVVSRALDFDKDLPQQLQGSEGEPIDMAILSTAILNGNTTKVLAALTQTMRPGGFLLLLEHGLQATLRSKLRGLGAESSLPLSRSHDTAVALTPPDLPEVLHNNGFIARARNSDQAFMPAFSIVVRQLFDSSMDVLEAQTGSKSDDSVCSHLLIVSGTSKSQTHLAQMLQRLLQTSCARISLSNGSFEAVDPATGASCDAVIMLADLESSSLAQLTDRSLDNMRGIMRPNVSVLWLTHNGRFGEPDQAATLGFTRTIVAEVPNLKVQCVDMETSEPSEQLVAESFIRFIKGIQFSASNTQALWIAEPELHLEGSQTLIPRVVPFKPGNDRFNSVRRPITQSSNTLRNAVDVVTFPVADQTRCDVRPHAPEFRGSGEIEIAPHYSSLHPVISNSHGLFHACIGKNAQTGQQIAALSRSCASRPIASLDLTQALSIEVADSVLLLSLLLHCLIAEDIVSAIANSGHQSVLVLGADSMLLHCLCRTAQGSCPGVDISSSDIDANGVADVEVSGVKSSSINPHASARAIRSMFPASGCYVADFWPRDGSLYQRFRAHVPANCIYDKRGVFSGATASCTEGNNNMPLATLWEKAMSSAQSLLEETERNSLVNVLSLAQLGSDQKPIDNSLFHLIDWRKDRLVAECVNSLVESSLFSADKTYILVGLTRDFGQSLARLFVEHGARHIVLCSRNPNVSTRWISELKRTHDANVKIERLDVTAMDSVVNLRQRLAAYMPPVGGLVNGAMVLDDRVFSRMTAHTWNRVMRPKTVGSKNLDAAFASDDLEFFIMTSSFAAIGGHPAQSNYATANMFMNGLAANRRARGLAGSVLNIGVVYGLGFLHREKSGLYGGLEREGYPPISERDLHHMFLEAIVAGRPKSPNQPYDLVTGLRRFRPTEPTLNWHFDPRFGHYTLDDGDVESGLGKGAIQSVMEKLHELKDHVAIAEVIESVFLEKLEALLQIPSDGISKEHHLADFGIDSLVAVEIRKWFWNTTGRDVPVLKILGRGSIHQLCMELAEQTLSEREKEIESA